MKAEMDLRNLIPGERAEGVKCCGVCGKPEATATKAVKDLPAHKAAIEANLPEKWRMITKALGSNLMDFVTRERFNAQLESIRGLLVKAREEHDAHTPEAKLSDKAKLSEVLGKTLALVGIKLANGEHTPLALADRLHAELARLMEIKAEVAADAATDLYLETVKPE